MGWFRPGCDAAAAASTRRSCVGCEVALIEAGLSRCGLDGQCDEFDALEPLLIGPEKGGRFESPDLVVSKTRTG